MTNDCSGLVRYVLKRTGNPVIALFYDGLSAHEHDFREWNRQITRSISCILIEPRYAIEEVSESEELSEPVALALRVHFAAQPTTRSYHLHWDQHRDPATSQLLLSGSGASGAKWISAREDRNAVQPLLCEIRHFTDFRRGHFMFMMHHASPMMDEPSDPLGGRQHLDLTAV